MVAFIFVIFYNTDAMRRANIIAGMQEDGPTDSHGMK